MNKELVPVNYHPEQLEVKVIVEKHSTGTFNVPNGTRAEIEEAIAKELRSDKELVWIDSPDGIRAVCISLSAVWRPRRRFSINNEGSEQ